MRAVSDKRRAQNVEFAKVREFVMERDDNTCQLGVESSFAKLGLPIWPDPCCSGPLDPHHMVTRARDSKLALEPTNLIVLCRRHHDQVHANVALATEHGLLRSAPVPALPKEETT